MKKIIISFLLMLLTSCNQGSDLDKNAEYINENEYLKIAENQVFEENTYYLDLNLNPEESTLDVIGKIVYLNDVKDFDELYLKIYPNATTIKSSGYNVDFEYLLIDDIEYPVIYSGDDNTTIHIDLEETLEEGKSFDIDFKYEFTYWNEDRIADFGDYFITMFFYPFVAMYDDFDGWQVDPYTFHGESYYNEIGDYYVSLQVPVEYEVAPSGKVEEIQTSNQSKTINMFLDNGRDFSFSASPLYNIYTEIIDGREFNIYSIRQLSQTEINSSFDYLEYTFEIFEEYVGGYYYDYFNLEYGYIYGMESTGVIYCSEQISEITVVHEVIHQWFYSMIHNDQSNESFIDESLTTYTTYIYLLERYGPISSNQYLDYRSSMKAGFESRLNQYRGESLLQKVDAFGDGYGYIIYYHGPTILRYYFDEVLSGDINVLQEFLVEYYDMYHGKEVTLEEFLDLLEDSTGQEGTVEWFMEQLESLDVLTGMEE